jgi:hypothetical protein
MEMLQQTSLVIVSLAIQVALVRKPATVMAAVLKIHASAMQLTGVR